MMIKFIDLTGKRFGRLTVLERDGHNSRGNIMWWCRCDCGGVARVSGGSLKSGMIKSCGCIRREAVIKTRATHGCSKERLYGIWRGMISRCYNPNLKAFEHYGGREINVCNEWHDFNTFRDWSLSHGYQEDLTIDRINVNGDYEPSNCRWVDMIAQANNKRNTKSITHNGVTQPIAEWARQYNIPYTTLYERIKNGWDIKKSLTQPVKSDTANKE